MAAVPAAEEKDTGERRVLQEKPGLQTAPEERRLPGAGWRSSQGRGERPEGRATFFF